MVGVFSWNDVDVSGTFNFDPGLKLSLSQGHNIDFFLTFNWLSTTLYIEYLIELLQLNCDNSTSVCLDWCG